MSVPSRPPSSVHSRWTVQCANAVYLLRSIQQPQPLIGRAERCRFQIPGFRFQMGMYAEQPIGCARHHRVLDVSCRHRPGDLPHWQILMHFSPWVLWVPMASSFAGSRAVVSRLGVVPSWSLTGWLVSPCRRWASFRRQRFARLDPRPGQVVAGSAGPVLQRTGPSVQATVAGRGQWEPQPGPLQGKVLYRSTTLLWGVPGLRGAAAAAHPRSARSNTFRTISGCAVLDVQAKGQVYL